jgi:transposase
MEIVLSNYWLDRYILYKSQDKWTPNQKQRADILFEQYPDIQKAYKLSQGLKLIFNLDIIKEVARVKLAKWYNDVEDSGFKAFNIISNTIKLNYDTILNYFKNRSTNASAESFNAKIKAFRSQFRGVKNMEFFLYRLTKIYA